MTAKKDSPANLQEEFAPTLLFGDCRPQGRRAQSASGEELRPLLGGR
jgi:hypothetical protein